MKAEAKNRTITVFPKRNRDVGSEQTPLLMSLKLVQFAQGAQASVPRVFSVQEAMQSLSDLNRFINNQEAMILTLEARKLNSKQVGFRVGSAEVAR